jgi:hypothetical protein
MTAFPRPSGSHWSRIGPSSTVLGPIAFWGMRLGPDGTASVYVRQRVAMLTSFGRKPGALIKAL